MVQPHSCPSLPNTAPSYSGPSAALNKNQKADKRPQLKLVPPNFELNTNRTPHETRRHTQLEQPSEQPVDTNPKHSGAVTEQLVVTPELSVAVPFPEKEAASDTYLHLPMYGTLHSRTYKPLKHAGLPNDNLHPDERRLWFRKKTGGPATSLIVRRSELVDDVKTRILSKYPTSLQQRVDPADLVLTFQQSSGVRLELQPDDNIVSVLDEYFHGAMRMQDAVEIGPPVAFWSGHTTSTHGCIAGQTPVTTPGTGPILQQQQQLQQQQLQHHQQQPNIQGSNGQGPNGLGLAYQNGAPNGGPHIGGGSASAVNLTSPPVGAASRAAMHRARSFGQYVTHSPSLAASPLNGYTNSTGYPFPPQPQTKPTTPISESSRSPEESHAISSAIANTMAGQPPHQQSSPALAFRSDSSTSIASGKSPVDIPSAVAITTPGGLGHQLLGNQGGSSSSLNSAESPVVMNHSNGSSPSSVGNNTAAVARKPAKSCVVLLPRQMPLMPKQKRSKTKARGVLQEKLVDVCMKPKQEEEKNLVGAGTNFGIEYDVEFDVAKQTVRGASNVHFEHFRGTVVPQINMLIVEDNSINQRLLVRFLQKKKVRHEVAKTGREALDKWKSGDFHLILMDIQLPVMTGLEATKEIRRLEAINGIGAFQHSQEADSAAPLHLQDVVHKREGGFRSPVIIVALTASSDSDDKTEALGAGCNDFLTKPVNYTWLEKKIIEWGCMQALIDFDGWKSWNANTEKETKEDTLTEMSRAQTSEEPARQLSGHA